MLCVLFVHRCDTRMCLYVWRPWGVPIHILWHSVQCLCWPQRALVSGPTQPAHPAAVLPMPGPVGCVSLSGSPSVGPSQGFGQPGPALLSLPPSFPARQAGVGAAWRLPLAEAQVQAVLTAPRTPHKLGRQENTRHSCAKVAAGGQAAGGGGHQWEPEPPGHGEATVPGWLCSICLYEGAWVCWDSPGPGITLPIGTGQGSTSGVGLVRGPGEPPACLSASAPQLLHEAPPAQGQK